LRRSSASAGWACRGEENLRRPSSARPQARAVARPAQPSGSHCLARWLRFAMAIVPTVRRIQFCAVERVGMFGAAERGLVRMSCMIVRLSLPFAPLWRACASAAERAHCAAGIGTTILRHMLDSFRRSMSCRGVVVGLGEICSVEAQQGGH